MTMRYQLNEDGSVIAAFFHRSDAIRAAELFTAASSRDYEVHDLWGKEPPLFFERGKDDA